jgi:hypothetical protein
MLSFNIRQIVKGTLTLFFVNLFFWNSSNANTADSLEWDKDARNNYYGILRKTIYGSESYADLKGGLDSATDLIIKKKTKKIRNWRIRKSQSVVCELKTEVIKAYNCQKEIDSLVRKRNEYFDPSISQVEFIESMNALNTTLSKKIADFDGAWPIEFDTSIGSATANHFYSMVKETRGQINNRYSAILTSQKEMGEKFNKYVSENKIPEIYNLISIEIAKKEGEIKVIEAKMNEFKKELAKYC